MLQLKLIVVMAQEQNGIVIDKAQAKILQPSGTAYDAAGKVGHSGKIHHRLKLPIEATQSKRVAICIKPPRSRSYSLTMPALNIETKLLGIFSRKNAKCGAGVHLRQ